MKTRINDASCEEGYLTAFGLDPDKVIYFDIETTGFRASTSSLYMIGWAVRNPSILSISNPGFSKPHNASSAAPEKGWTVTQIIAESFLDEKLLLEQFGQVLSRYDTIIEFNGDRFDLPYLREKYEAYGMEDPFTPLRSVDLYREIRPYKDMLSLKKLNQKSVERFLMIKRQDPFNGGELIDVYRSLRDHSCDDRTAALHALFLHNYEDVVGMLAMTPLLAYPMAIQSTAPVRILKNPWNSSEDSEDIPGLAGLADSEDLKDLDESGKPIEGSYCLEVEYPLEVSVPIPLHLAFGEHCLVTLSGDHVYILLRPLSGTLRHFFPDYRNYYYLPAEDTAIHKSVASFVDPSHREKAKAQNCYAKKQGFFLPQPEESFTPVFQRSYKDPAKWFECICGWTDNTDALSAYIHTLVRAANVP